MAHNYFSRIALIAKVAIANFTIGCLFVMACSISSGQDAASPDQDAAGSNMVTEFKGKLKSFERGVMVVIRDDGTEVMVQPPDSPESFVFVAEAKPMFLQRGMMARFRGTFTAAGAATQAIEKVELFQPLAGNLSGRAREQFVPGIYGERRNRNEPVPQVATVNVVGGILGMDGTGIMIQAGKIPVQAPLTPDVKFEIRFNNLSLAQEGDSVSVEGFYQPPDDTKVKGDRVVVTTDRIYGEPAAAPVRKTRRSRRTADQEAEKGDDKATDDADTESPMPETPMPETTAAE
ncbi:hypothetical protein [Rubripirellula reticaptiva]|uniref:DUF5666 domain-containing protein n=1 Tax=Rubripirellula reticaptiva TaxID=2528013 RepID=A0A5C6EN09_9BACT|nr:hypothetical protein [Rubripirellula reticaptiva]TWU49744.1 hypothetical protein Poly59_43690 [Rubripirellula reticaptiva]